VGRPFLFGSRCNSPAGSNYIIVEGGHDTLMRWEDIVDQHGPLVWRTAYRLLGNDADAADCYQEAFAAALAVARREHVQNWPGMLRKLATIHALDRVRRRLRRPTSDLDGAGALASSVGEPSESAEKTELAERLRAALAELPPLHAQAISLTSIEGLTYEQAAAELDVTPGHLGVLLHRARARLRELLAPAMQPRER
jgi:RNA polymerase sigma-70 factor (ECF subfamily)